MAPREDAFIVFKTGSTHHAAYARHRNGLPEARKNVQESGASRLAMHGPT